MSELVTLHRQDPAFRSYLLGTFSNTHRALPVKSLNVRTDVESVTFRVVPLDQVPRPSGIVIALKALRPRSFLTVLAPLLFVMAVLSQRLTLDPDLPWLAFVGLMSLFAALLLRNDVQDHLNGFDRVRADRGSRAIQNGWATAAGLNQVSWGFLVLALFAAVPLSIARPSAISIFAVAALLTGAGLFRPERSFRDLRGGELTLFFLCGPLLFCGLEWILAESISTEVALAGLVWGWLALFPVHLRDFENLIIEGQSGRGSLIGRLGFDRGLRWLNAWWVIGLAGFAFFLFMHSNRVLSSVLLFLLVLVSIRFSLRLKKLASPAGSEVAQLRRQGELLYDGFILIWILESVWRLQW